MGDFYLYLGDASRWKPTKPHHCQAVEWEYEKSTRPKNEILAALESEQKNFKSASFVWLRS